VQVQDHPAVRRVARRLPRPVRRAAARALHRIKRPTTVSVIMPVYNVETFLDQCIASVRRQSYPHLDIVVIDDGSTDRSGAIAAQHAAEDRRIRVMTQENAGLGAARNTGIRRAIGDYLCFVDSDDVLPADSVSTMLAAAQESGSDIVAGLLERFNETDRWQPDWAALHQRRQLGVTLLQLPDLVRNNYSCGKLFAADFWRRSELWFREGVAYEDQPLITRLYLRANGIDVVPDVTYHWRQRTDRSSISQQTHSQGDLEDRIAAWDLSRETLSAEAPEPVYRAWLKTLYTTHFHWYLRSSSTDDDRYWQTLQAAVVRLTDGTPEEWLADVPPSQRVAVELTRRDLRPEFEQFKREDGYELREFPAVLTGDGLRFELPTWGDASIALPARMYCLADEGVPLVHRLDSAAWTADGRLRLSGWAYFRHVDLARYPTRTTLTLTHTRTGSQSSAVCDTNLSPTLIPPTDDAWASYSAGAFVADVSLSALVGDGELLPDDEFTLSVTVTTDRLSRTIPVVRVPPASPARLLRARAHGEGILYFADSPPGQPFAVRYWVPSVRAHDLAFADGVLSGRLSTAGTALTEASLVPAGSEQDAITVPVQLGGTFHVPLEIRSPSAPPRADGSIRWGLRARERSGAWSPAALAGDLPSLSHTSVGSASARLEVSPRATVLVRTAPAQVWIDDARIDGEEMHVAGLAAGVHKGRIALRLKAEKAASTEVEADVVDGRFAARLPLRHRAWRQDVLPLPTAVYTATYAVQRDDSSPIHGTAQVDRGLAPRLPLSQEGRVVATTLNRGPHGVLQLRVHPPVQPGARSAFDRAKLERAHETRIVADGPLHGLLIETNFGEIAGCNGAAIHRELRRRGAQLPVYWAVRDYSVPVPEGGIPVVRNSPDWFRALRTAKYFIENMYQPLYHHKPTGQVVVATFHGYPFKQMGHPHWRNLRLPQSRIESFVRRTCEWDFLVSPARYATPLLRQHFGYDGRVLEVGYPRNDVLVSEDGPAIRVATRDSLGIAGSARVVLYAPTFRDYLAIRDRRAPLPDFLDPDELVRALGPDTVLLMRGHAFNARVRARVERSAQVIDVTDYPDPADLYLASDIAILDYSSLRFDYAVTGKPMLFLVPDLVRYQDSRGWLFEFEPTAPGPLLDTTAQVVEAIRDIDAVVDEYAIAYERFRKDFLDLEDGEASARVVDAVFVPNGDADRRDSRR
jgi:CDP-glycerol glycerophosphotransferase